MIILFKWRSDHSDIRNENASSIYYVKAFEGHNYSACMEKSWWVKRNLIFVTSFIDDSKLIFMENLAIFTKQCRDPGLIHLSQLLTLKKDLSVILHSSKETQVDLKYSARRLIGSRIIESAVYCNKKLQAHLYLNTKLVGSLIESFGYCYHFYVDPK